MTSYTRYAVYDPTTGRIHGTGVCPADVAAVQGAGEGFASYAGFPEDADDGTTYIATPATAPIPTPRPLPAIDRMSVPADGATPVTLSNLPDPATLRIDGVPHAVTGGTAQVAFATAASYALSVDESFPHAPWRSTVVAS